MEIASLIFWPSDREGVSKLDGVSVCCVEVM